MKGKTLGFFAAWSLAVTLASPLHAQSVASMAVRIPFDFVVNKEMLPAGEYRIAPYSGVLQVRSAAGKAATLAQTVSVHGQETTTPPRLVFHRYGNANFLFQVWMPANRTWGRQIIPSKLELEVAKDSREPHIESVLAQGR